MSDPLENSLDPARNEPGTPQTATRTVCRQCFELLDVGDNFCRYCGGMTEAGEALVRSGRLSPPAAHATPAKAPSWTESPVVVLLGLFVVLGPLALPMLWRSRRFTRIWKIALTVVVLVVTVAVFWSLAELLTKSLEPLQEPLQELRRSGLL
jgi:hypothetical protein